MIQLLTWCGKVDNLGGDRSGVSMSNLYKVWDLGFRVWGLGFRVWGLGFRV
jgi:hypothetical protein